MTNIVIALIITVSLAHVVQLSPIEQTTEHIDKIEEKVNDDVESSTIGVDSVIIGPLKNTTIEERSGMVTETITEPVKRQSITTENIEPLVTENNLDEVTTVQSKSGDVENSDIVEDVDTVVKSLTHANSSDDIIGTRRSYSSPSHSENNFFDKKPDTKSSGSKSKSKSPEVTEKVNSGFKNINKTTKTNNDSLESKEKILADEESNDKQTNIESTTKTSIIDILSKQDPTHIEVDSKVADDEIEEKSAEPAVEIENKSKGKPINIKSISEIITKPEKIKSTTKTSIIDKLSKQDPTHIEVESKVANDEIEEKSAEPAVEIENKSKSKPTNIKSIPEIITKPEKINDNVEGKSNTDDFEEHHTEMVPTNESKEHSETVTVKAPNMNGHPLKKRRKLKNLSPDNQPTLNSPNSDTLQQNATPHVTNIRTHEYKPANELIAFTPAPTNPIPSLLSFTPPPSIFTHSPTKVTPSPPLFTTFSPIFTPSPLSLTTSNPIFRSSPRFLTTSRPGLIYTSPEQSSFPIFNTVSSLIPSSFTPPIFHNFNHHPVPIRRNQFLWPQAPYRLQEDPNLNHYQTQTIKNINGDSQHHTQNENQRKIPETLKILAMMSQVSKPNDIYRFGNVFYDNNMYPLVRNGRDHRETVERREKLRQIPESVLDDFIRVASEHRKNRERDNVRHKS